jgi:hypothetical protein
MNPTDDFARALGSPSLHLIKQIPQIMRYRRLLRTLRAEDFLHDVSFQNPTVHKRYLPNETIRDGTTPTRHSQIPLHLLQRDTSQIEVSWDGATDVPYTSGHTGLRRVCQGSAGANLARRFLRLSQTSAW